MKWFPILFYILCCGIQAKHPNHTKLEKLKPPSNLTDSGKPKNPSEELDRYLKRSGRPIPRFSQKGEDSSTSWTDGLHNNSIEIDHSNKNRSNSSEPTTTPKNIEDETSKPGSNDSQPNEISKPDDHQKNHVKKNATIKKYIHNASVKTTRVYNTRYFGTYSPFNPFKLSTASRVSTDSYYGNGRWRHHGPWGSRYGYTRPEGWFPSDRNPGKFDFYLKPMKSRMSEFHNRGWRTSRYRFFKVNPCLFCETGCHSHCHHKHSKKSGENDTKVEDPHPSEEIQGTIIEANPKIQGQTLYSPSSKENESVDFHEKPFNISHYNLKHPHRLSPEIFEKIVRYLNGGKDFVYRVPSPITSTYRLPRPKPFWPFTNRSE